MIKQFLKEYWILITIVTLFVILQIVALQPHATPYWDAAVYVGSGKYLFSHGAVGTWEALRPVALPVVLGAFWKIGINPYTAGIVFSLIISAAFLVLVYVFAEDIKKDSGAIAAVLLASGATYFTFGAVPVTDITSTFFAVLALWLTYKAVRGSQYFVAGIVVAFAFMFRFPQGLLLVVTMLGAVVALFFEKRKKGKWNDAVVSMIERVFLIGGGFCVIVVPFLVVNYIAYGNPFLPFIQATAGITGYASLYQKGVWFYLVQFLREDFLYIAALIPFGLLFWKKMYRSKAVIMLTVAIMFVGGYFIVYQTHKELRYGLAFLPYVVILAGVGIMYVLEWTKMPRLLFFGLFGIAVFMFSVGFFVYAAQNPNNETFYEFNAYLKNIPDAHVLSSTPYMFAYSDTLLTHNLYGDWNDAYSDYNAFRSANDYIELDSCNLNQRCADDGGYCQHDKQALLDELNKQDTKFFDETTPQSQCELMIYKINH